MLPNMKFVFLAFILCLSAIQNFVSGQTFSFECLCDHVSNDTCDICPKVAGLQSRSFHGLLIRRNGTPYKWIDEPYTVKKFSNGTIEFLELLPNPDKVTIARFQTAFSTMQGFADSTNCSCNLGGAMGGAIEVDTPMVGDGTIGNPIKIGQFGADTTSFLNWKGDKWMPGKVQFSDIDLMLPYFISDSAALANGLSVGDAYLLDCDNSYTLPAGMLKIVKICGWNCSLLLMVYDSDIIASSQGIPEGREYILSNENIYGVLYGYIKSIATDRLDNDTLICNTSLLYFVSDSAALANGLNFGDKYLLEIGNMYGAPKGCERALLNSGIGTATSSECCQTDATLPYFRNNAHAISVGLISGNQYYLSDDNTVGMPYGTKTTVY